MFIPSSSRRLYPVWRSAAGLASRISPSSVVTYTASAIRSKRNLKKRSRSRSSSHLSPAHTAPDISPSKALRRSRSPDEKAPGSRVLTKHRHPLNPPFSSLKGSKSAAFAPATSEKISGILDPWHRRADFRGQRTIPGFPKKARCGAIFSFGSRVAFRRSGSHPTAAVTANSPSRGSRTNTTPLSAAGISERAKRSAAPLTPSREGSWFTSFRNPTSR